jgi:hypothetical protein
VGERDLCRGQEGKGVSDLELIPYEPPLKEAWDAVVRESKNGNFLHSRGYLEYHADRFDECSVVIYKKNRPSAVFPCNLHAGQIVSHGGLTYAGLIYGEGLHATEVLDVMNAVVAHLRDTGAATLLYKAVPHIFARYPAQEDVYALFRMNAKLVRRDLSSAILLRSRPKLSDSRKNTIRKAARNAVTVAETVDVPAVHALLTAVLVRFDRKPVHSIAELQLLRERFPDAIRLFGAFREGGLIAASVLYDFGSTVHTQYLASSDEGRELGALDMLLSHLIESFQDRTYFSFGSSTEDNGRHLNAGLVFQKEGFGGRGVVHDFYELDLL